MSKDITIGFTQAVNDKVQELGDVQDCVDTLIAAIIALEVYGVFSYDQSRIVAEAQKVAFKLAGRLDNLSDEGEEE